jgi:hypothetical protein
MSASDLKRLATFLDIAITSNQEGEAENALRRALSTMRQAKLRGSDFIEAMIERDQALDLVAKYSARLDQAEAENKRLRQANGNTPRSGLAAQPWQDAGAINTVTSRSAQWVLDLVAQGHVHLKAKDLDFVQSCARWSRPLTAGQEGWLLDIVRRVAKHTGASPPP